MCERSFRIPSQPRRLVAALFLIACPLSHSAVVEVSQNQVTAEAVDVYRARQSFVALSGQPIVGASLYLSPRRFFPSNRYTSLRVSLFISDADAGAVGTELAVGFASLLGVPSGPTPASGFYDVTFSMPFNQIAGERYLLSVLPFVSGGEDAEAGSIALGYSTANPYPDGIMAGAQLPGGQDLAFRTLVATIPEPSTASLIAALLSGLGLHRRRGRGRRR